MKNLSNPTHLLVFFLITLFFSSCTQNEHLKVALMLPNFTNQRYQRDRDFFAEYAKTLNVEVKVADGENDDQLQITQAKDFVDQGFQTIVITPVNRNTAAEIVRYAHSQGVKVIAYDRIISNCDLDCFFTFDNVKTGELMAQYAIQHKPEGTYFLMEGDKGDQNAIWVKEGHMKILDPYIKSGKIKIVYDTFIEEWNGDNANFELKRFVNFSGYMPDVIMAASDGLSVGVSRAVSETTKPTVYPIITGQNANLESCRNIASGHQSMTVYKPIKTFAHKALELAVKLAQNQKPEYSQTVFNGYTNVPLIINSVISVDADNIKSTIIADGFFKEADIYGK